MHPAAVPGPFWRKKASDRTPITTENCVFVVARKRASEGTEERTRRGQGEDKESESRAKVVHVFGLGSPKRQSLRDSD